MMNKPYFENIFACLPSSAEMNAQLLLIKVATTPTQNPLLGLERVVMPQLMKDDLPSEFKVV